MSDRLPFLLLCKKDVRAKLKGSLFVQKEKLGKGQYPVVVRHEQ